MIAVEIGLAVVLLVGVFAGFPLLDRWHERWAWRKAHGETPAATERRRDKRHIDFG